MDDLSQKYLDYKPIPFSSLLDVKKDSNKIFEVDLTSLSNYSAEDADITFRLYEKLSKEIEKDKLTKLAYEVEFKDKFPDCEVGAMPPFGNLYGLPVYVARSLSDDEEISFNGCSHKELIKMKYKDFERLAKPHILEFSYQTML